MTTLLLMQRDAAGENTFGLIPTDKKFKNILAAGVAKTVTAPEDANRFLAILSSQPGTSVWWAHNTTATLPTAGEFVAATEEQNVSSWVVNKGDTISAITNSTTAEVGVKFYAIQ